MCLLGKFFCMKIKIKSEYEKISLANCRQRGIYLTFGDTCVINQITKAGLCHQMCPERLAAKHKTSVPLVLCPRSSARRAEHARSHGTAASAAGKFCCMQCGTTLIYSAKLVFGHP